MAEAINKIGEHSGDTVHFLDELLVAEGFEIAEIVGQKEEVIELTGGPFGNRQEPGQFRVTTSTAPFGDVRRDRCGSSSQLAGQPEPFLLGEDARLTVHLQRQLVGSVPYSQVAKVSHLASREDAIGCWLSTISQY